MKTILKYPAAKASALLLLAFLSASPLLAQTTPTTPTNVSAWDTAGLKSGVGQIAGVLIIISWLLALLAWFVGAATKESNPAMSKYCFYIVWMFAIGGPVVGLIFKLVTGSSVITPSF